MFPGTENRNEGTFAKTTLSLNRPYVSCLFHFSSLKDFRGRFLVFFSVLFQGV